MVSRKQAKSEPGFNENANDRPPLAAEDLQYYCKGTGTWEGGKKLMVDCLLIVFARPRKKTMYKLNLDINKKQLRS